MKKFKILAFLLAVTFIAKANGSKKNTYEFSKSYQESFSVSAGSTLDLDSDFSTVEIMDWSHNQLSVDITVSVDSKNESSAQDFLRKAEVEISQSDNTVTVHTNFKGNHNWKHNSFDIHVVIKAPKSCKLNINHSFGSMMIGAFDEDTNIHSEYGSVTANALTGSNNQFKVAFGSSAISRFGGGNFHVEYGSAVIENLLNKCNFNNAFSELEITEIECTEGEIVINNSYGNTTIGIPSNHSFSFDTHSSFGDIDLPKGLEYSQKNSDSFSSSRKGTKGSSGVHFTIENSFGGVEIEYMD